MNNLESHSLFKLNKDEIKPSVSLLVNSIYYFIECVFILKYPAHFRLVALHRGHVLVDQNYRTFKGAKIAFTRMYRYKAWREGVDPEWSPFYSPESKWFDRRVGNIGESFDL